MSLDGISRVQKVAAVEKWFRGSLACFQGIRVHICEGTRSGEPRGWGHALSPWARLQPRDFLIASPTSSPSLLVCFRSKKDHREGFIPFGIPFLQNTEIGKKNRNWHWASG